MRIHVDDAYLCPPSSKAFHEWRVTQIDLIKRDLVVAAKAVAG